MTGTAWSARREFRQIYQLDVVTIPTHRPSRREVWPDAVFGSSDERWQAVVQEVRRIHLAGRPVLIGTRSIDKSEHLSALFQQAGVAHCVLNARQSAAEAEIVAAAGRLGQVTVATNMAGRGTDIGLADEVLELGGLHVIGTELHESARIDRQLSGRCGRQGDPGSFHQFMSLDDDIVKQGLGEKGAQRLRDLGQRNTGKCSRFAAKLRSAQKNVERQYFKQRRLLMFVEQERQRRQSAMGQDPYLDCA